MAGDRCRRQKNPDSLLLDSNSSPVPSLSSLLLRLPPWFDVGQDRARVLNIASAPESNGYTSDFFKGRRLDCFIRDVPLKRNEMKAQLLSSFTR